MRYLMYDSTVEFMVKRKKWGYDEEELEKVQKDYEQIKSIVDRYIKLGMLSQDGDYLLLRDKSLCNTVLACHLGTKVSSKRKLMDEVLRFGREHNTLVSGKKYVRNHCGPLSACQKKISVHLRAAIYLYHAAYQMILSKKIFLGAKCLLFTERNENSLQGWKK